ncbi:Transcription elongation factor (TFIIS) family protein [Abeliophyllum distichum]|uniref:Transcription elongation factor (TFIIS) family protein n=1 Tax=Abeliophyllum distichum TaxID=126358 RepID=A0ABD1SF79_9LAMI
MLEDFFTLTEMNNGLTAPVRVRELLALMEKESDYIAKNLEGLQLMDKWLKDAQKFSNDTNDSSVEECITHLLGALEKLHVDNVKLVSWGIWTTVEDLLGHNSPKVQHRAKTLFDSWKKDGDNGASSQNVKIVGESLDGGMRVSADIKRDFGHKESSFGDAPLPRESFSEEKHQESTRNDPLPSTSFDALQTNKVEDALASERSLGQSPSFSKAVNEIICDTVDPPLSISKGSASTESCSFTVQKKDMGDGPTDFHESEFACEVKQTPNINSSPEKLGTIEESKLLEDGAYPSRSGAAIGLNSVLEPSLQKLADASDGDSRQKGFSFDDAKTIDSEGGAVDDGGCANQHRSLSAFRIKEGGDCKTDDDERSWENLKNSKTFSLRIKDAGGIDKLDQHVTGQSDDDLANDYNFVKHEMDLDPDKIDKKSKSELDYGIVDPLELARQVAIEVEREVYFREHSFSSPEKVREDEIQQPDSPDTVSRIQSHALEGPHKEEETEPAQSAEASPIQEESALDADEKNGTQDMETSLVTEVAPEEVNTEKGLCNFDLNLEVCSEDTYCVGNQDSIPVSIVSASRVAGNPGLPVTPLQFEGNLGWKGSAATSAFHPASPRHIHEGDKAEASSISEHLELDLNRASEDGDVPSDWRTEGQIFPHRNGHHSQSHPSSSSSKQPSLRNFDLNDQPAFLNNWLDHSYFRKSPNNSNVISIMGTKVEVKHKDFVPEALPLPNGRTPELALDINLGRSGSVPGTGSVFYDVPTVYSYSGHAPGPAMPFTSTMYGPGGPIPYMVDSRGAHVVPQILGSASALQPSFLTMAGSTASNGVWPSRSSLDRSLDLNSVLTLEGGSRDPAGLGPFFSSGQSSTNSQPSISSVGGKRKEPDTGWEDKPPFKHHTPPWK